MFGTAFLAPLIMAFSALGAAETPDIAIRYGIWPRFEEWIQKDGEGFTVPARTTTDWKGFNGGKDGLTGGDRVGDSFTYVADRAGVFYLAVTMNDDEDGVERLAVALNGARLGCIVADDIGRSIFALSQPFTLAPGDKLVFTCETPVGYYRVSALHFSAKPIRFPALEFENIEAWCIEPGAVKLCWTTSRIAETGFVEYWRGEDRQKSPADSYTGRNHRISLAGLDAKAAYSAQLHSVCDGKPVISEIFSFSPTPPVSASARLSVPLRVVEPSDRTRANWPATAGLPFPQGAIADVRDIALADQSGAPVLAQAEPFSRWPDGSLKWVVLSFLAASGSANDPGDYQVEIGTRAVADRPAALLNVSDSGAASGAIWKIETDTVSFQLSKTRPALFDGLSVDADGDGVKEPFAEGTAGGGLRVTGEDGAVWVCGAPRTAPRIEVNGPVRGVLTWEGPLVTEAAVASGWAYRLSATFRKGFPGFDITVSVYNDQGAPTFRALSAVELYLPIAHREPLRAAFDTAPLTPVATGEGLSLLQYDENHLRTAPENSMEPSRSLGVVSAEADGRRCTVWTRDFRQTYPKGYRVDDGGIAIQLLPPLPADAYREDANRPWYYRLYAWCRDGKYVFRAGQMTQSAVTFHFAAARNVLEPGVLAGWLSAPLMPAASPEYLCGTGALGRPVFPRTPGVWEDYDKYFDIGFSNLTKDRDSRRTYSWMHYGDWYGERICNYGNSEYDLAWALGMEWFRGGDRLVFERGLDMARHNTTVDTIHGAAAEGQRGLVWEHCFNHVGTSLTREALTIPADDQDAVTYFEDFGRMFGGAMDSQGHIFQQGNWLYAALTGDPWLRACAERICTQQAAALTPSFDFTIERSGGWPLINAATAYSFSGDPYYLNAARLMVQRCFEREDPEVGGWPHRPPSEETENVPVWGGKAFAVGILGEGLLRYIDAEPEARPDVRAMLVRGADWLMKESWIPGQGFRYITNAPNYVNTGSRGMTCLLVSDIIAFAYQETGDTKYLDFFKEMMAGCFDPPPNGIGKGFTQGVRQTVHGLGRVRQWGITAAP